jgi:hypothetical protein
MIELGKEAYEALSEYQLDPGSTVFVRIFVDLEGG